MNVSLALGGGGTKGFAHIGVIDCLEKSGMRIAAVAGTSIGGLVGAIYAAGLTPAQIMELVEDLNPASIYARKPGDGPALLGYQGLADKLTPVLGDKDFSDLKIPFACTAVNLSTSREVYLNSGRVKDAVLATLALPGIFPPMAVGGAELIDGGVLDPVPVRLARLLAPNLPVIAVALNPELEEWDQLPQLNINPLVPQSVPHQIIEGLARTNVGQALQIFVQSIDITGRMLTELRLEVDRPDVILRPPVHHYGMLDPIDPQIAYEAGMQVTQAALKKIKGHLTWSNTVFRILMRPSLQKTEREKARSSLQTLLTQLGNPDDS